MKLNRFQLVNISPNPLGTPYKVPPWLCRNRQMVAKQYSKHRLSLLPPDILRHRTNLQVRPRHSCHRTSLPDR